MPRPPIYQKGAKAMPSAQLEEVKFWLAIMQEHTVFIRAGIPAEHTDLINEAKNFYQELGALRARADKMQTEKKFMELVNDAQSVITELLKFKRQLLHLAMTGRLDGCNPPLFYDHVAREAEYVLQLLEEIKKYNAACRAMSKAQEVAFWLRLMAEHARFIVQRLDPSERNLVGTAAGFAEEFDQLYLQGKDYVSMLRGYNRDVPAFHRFLQDTRVATLQLRDFKKAVMAMVEEQRLLGTIPALLADHVRREADHFLVVLAMLEKGLKTYMESDEIGFGSELAIEDTESVLADSDCATLTPTSADIGPCSSEDVDDACSEELICPQPNCDDDFETDDCLDDDEIDDDADILLTLPPQKETKYKWTGKWPRPLGQVPDSK